MRKAFYNCRVYTGEEVLTDKAVIIGNGIIQDIIDINKLPNDLVLINLQGANIAPGFIDLQVNGGGGFLFNDDQTPESIKTICDAHRKYGTTNLLLTIITTSMDKMLQATESLKRFRAGKDSGVLGLHLEGPFISKDKAGVHDKRHIRPFSTEELSLLLENGSDVIRLITVAPEVIEGCALKMLLQNGIIVSAGHTNATYYQAIEAFGQGVNAATHLFNAMSQLGSREPGMVGAILNSNAVYAGIIVDGIHVDYANVRLAKELKREKLFLVTDAMPPVGTEDTSFCLGDLEVECFGCRCVTKDGTLAGSGLNMMAAVVNCIKKVGIPVDEALRMASTYPAELLKLGSQLGKIKAGYSANMVIFDNTFTVKGTVLNDNYEAFI